MKAKSKKADANDRKIKAAYAIVDRRPCICAGCHRHLHGTRGHHSHTISRATANGIGKEWLKWTVDNIELLCMSCHDIWEHGSWLKKMNLRNFRSMACIIMKYHPTGYMKMQMALEDMGEEGRLPMIFDKVEDIPDLYADEQDLQS